MQYEILESVFGNIIQGTDENGKIVFIPEDPANEDYQIYLASLNEVPA